MNDYHAVTWFIEHQYHSTNLQIYQHNFIPSITYSVPSIEGMITVT